jgi:FkbM family methyltransferase
MENYPLQAGGRAGSSLEYMRMFVPSTASPSLDPGLSALHPFGAYPPNRLQSFVRQVGARLPPNRPGRVFSGWLRSLSRAITRGPIDVTVLGQRMRLRLGDNACERRLMVTPQFFDPDELRFLAARIGPGFHFVDIGANVGTYSVYVAKLAGPEARVLAIEPQAEMVARLRENAAFNSLNVRIAPFAVSDREGFCEFVVDTHNFGFTSLNTKRRGRSERHFVRLPTRRLIDVLREHGFERIDALKADVEGAEDLALLPFFEEAPQSLWPKLLIIEDGSADWRRNCVTFLTEHGYRVMQRTANIVLERGETPA